MEKKWKMLLYAVGLVLAMGLFGIGLFLKSYLETQTQKDIALQEKDVVIQDLRNSLATMDANGTVNKSSVALSFLMFKRSLSELCMRISYIQFDTSGAFPKGRVIVRDYEFDNTGFALNWTLVCQTSNGLNFSNGKGYESPFYSIDYHDSVNATLTDQP